MIAETCAPTARTLVYKCGKETNDKGNNHFYFI